MSTLHKGGDATVDKVKVHTIIVNGREKEFEGKEISFEQVIILAFGVVSPNPNISYTVTYKRGEGNKPQGTLVAGESVKVKEGMIFNATATDKS
ncbi:MAG TPA: multiubiquitin domain-containing protein [Cyclobacteriaceae bacterium]|nr:hypothetical protein [Cytophagales bacterium]HRE68873.1 multiubiquitin domain-containing protein [Cyclobacteriaceae bacterium]HRF35388.1 multiubiquitin domain-containing protein [Cyclobacteriaceae bacterium]